MADAQMGESGAAHGPVPRQARLRVVCPYCHRNAALVSGAAIYPGRHDLAGLKFWQCEPCGAWVGCHRAGSWEYIDGKRVTHVGIEPLGRLANAELRTAKQRAHAAFDPLWKDGSMPRREAYRWLAGKLGISEANCHIGMFDVAACVAVVHVMRERREGAANA